MLPVEMVERKTKTPEKYFLDAARCYICNVSKAATENYSKIADEILGEMNDGKLKSRSDVVTRLVNKRIMGSGCLGGAGVGGECFFMRGGDVRE